MPALVGRDRELGELLAAWDTAAGGAGGVVLITGEGGIGKTRLATELTARATAAGARTAICAGFDLAGAPPMGLWAELISELGGTLEAPPLQASWPSDLATLVPELERRFDRDHVDRPVASPEFERARVYEATLELINWAARARPLLLVMEDVHLADAASLQLAGYVARRLARLPVLIVLTSRPLPHRSELDALAQLVRARGILRAQLTLGPLASDSLVALVSAAADLDVMPSPTRSARRRVIRCSRSSARGRWLAGSANRPRACGPRCRLRWGRSIPTRACSRTSRRWPGASWDGPSWSHCRLTGRPRRRPRRSRAACCSRSVAAWATAMRCCETRPTPSCPILTGPGSTSASPACCGATTRRCRPRRSPGTCGWPGATSWRSATSPGRPRTPAPWARWTRLPRCFARRASWPPTMPRCWSSSPRWRPGAPARRTPRRRLTGRWRECPRRARSRRARGCAGPSGTAASSATPAGS